MFEGYLICPVDLNTRCKLRTFSSFGTSKFPQIPFSVLENTPFYTKLNYPICFHANKTIITSLGVFVSLSNKFLAHFFLGHQHY